MLTEGGSEGWVGQKRKKEFKQDIFSILMYAPTSVFMSLNSRKTDTLSRISVGL